MMQKVFYPPPPTCSNFSQSIKIQYYSLSDTVNEISFANTCIFYKMNKIGSATYCNCICVCCCVYCIAEHLIKRWCCTGSQQLDIFKKGLSS